MEGSPGEGNGVLGGEGCVARAGGREVALGEVEERVLDVRAVGGDGDGRVRGEGRLAVVAGETAARHLELGGIQEHDTAIGTDLDVGVGVGGEGRR